MVSTALAAKLLYALLPPVTSAAAGAEVPAVGGYFTHQRNIPPRFTKTNLSLVVFLLSMVFTFIAVADTSGGVLNPSEERGKQIYFTGLSPSGEEIIAHFGEKKQELPGEAATCGSCHGYDGTGRPESGLIPTNITWKYLIKSYGHIHASGVEHGPFSEESIKKYLKSGVYPGGARGDPSMPLYSMSDRDLDDLIGYIKLVGELPDPGLSDRVVKVGTFIPTGGPLAGIGGAIRGILSAYFSEVSSGGGINGRKIELVVHEVTGDRQSAVARVKAWLAEQQTFVLVSSFTPDLELDIQSVTSAEGLPLVGPFTLYPTEKFTLNRYVFYLFSGLAVQARALIHYASRRLELVTPRVAVLYPEKKSLDQVIAAVVQDCKSKGWQAVLKKPFSLTAFDATQSARQLQEAGVDLVIFLGVEGQLRSFLEVAASKGWLPYVLAPGVLSGRLVVDAPRYFEKRLYLAYPTLPRDRKGWAVKELSALMKAHNLQPTHGQAVISTYSAAKILVEAMRLSGRDLDRKKVTAALEKFYQFDTGLTPPITYTPNRRIGAKGAYILGFDPNMRGLGGAPGSAEWIDLQ
jgi:ABC-type branched-subunit amino acid transport system substrate-binding protein/cytochrome c553